MLDPAKDLDALRGKLERYVGGQTSVDSLRSSVDSIIEQWSGSRPEDRPPLADIEGRLWHVVWQIETACAQELAPDGARSLIDILEGRLPSPAARIDSRP